MRKGINSTPLTDSFAENSLTEYVYQQVKNKIIFLHYKPDQFLTETMLSSEYQVSKMPVKMAINELIKEGWLIADFRKKTKVKGITKKDILSIYDFRSLIENYAIDIVFQKQLAITQAKRLEKILPELQNNRDNPQSYLLSERTMHATLISVCENERITNVYDNLQDEIIRISHLSQINQSINKNTEYINIPIESWQSLIGHIRSKEYLLAKRELMDHLQFGRQNALHALEQWQQINHLTVAKKKASEISKRRGADLLTDL